MLAVALVALAAASSPPPPARFLSVDARHHVVDVSLVAEYDGTNSGFNFDGYSRELLWTVPVGWRVRVTCLNRGPLRHSCAVVAGAGSTRPAFPGAETPAPFTGLEARHSATFTFRASKRGVFRFADLVPGHEAARMYDVLQVTKGGKPSIRDLRAP
ncbi:MAG TPA: sulfocyanin-like copper-binding protein [Gaiellaceae bacterium]|nr:sulfocyanin-like copper-binding protein [Gaiellaceae bacterium]